MNKHLIAAALLVSTAALPAVASAQNYDYAHRNNGGYNGGGYGTNTQGTIGAVRGGDIQLTDGRNIFLHDGTVINPRGTSLQPGQQISVTGSRGGNGAINADQINVNGSGYGHGNSGYGNGNGNGNGNGGWNNRNGNWNDRDRRDGDRRDRDDRWQHQRHHDGDNNDNNNDRH